MNADQLRDLAALRACGRRHSWREIADHLGVSWQSARSQWRRKAKKLDPGVCPLCGPSTEHRSSWKVQGNYAEGTIQQEDPLDLPAFLELLQVDTDTWQVKDWEASRWQQNVNRRGELTFTASILDGHLEYSPEIINLWAHRAKFIRREPIALAPVVQPVECPVSYPAAVTATGKVRRALLISDLHIGYERDNRTGKLRPFHDRRAIDLVLRLVSQEAYNYIGILGDLLDLTNWNDKYSRSPEFYWTTQPSLLEGHWILRQLRELQRSAIIEVFAGNHENRIKRSLEKHLIEAYDLRAADEMDLPPALSPARLLALHQLGIGWINEYPAGERWLGPLRLSHGEVARKPPGSSARAVVDDSACDNAFGHTHRLELVSKRIRGRYGPRVVKSMSIGCLCHTDGRVPPAGSPEHWQEGFAEVSYTDQDWAPTLVSIDNGRGIAGGCELHGEDYTDRLREDLSGWNW